MLPVSAACSALALAPYRKLLLNSTQTSGLFAGFVSRCSNCCIKEMKIEFEPGLQRDLPEMLDRLIPPSRSYGHEQAWHDGNGHSHLQATLLGPSLSIPVASGQPVLGTWQQIIHLECDVRPRQRTVVVTVMGE
jgi:secondary thiamine-phosphate synthase enzyme